MLDLIYDPAPSAEKIALLQRGLDAHAHAERGMQAYEPCAFFIYDQQKIVGGIYATIYYGCTYIESLWVHTDLRGQGYGTKLLQAVEKYSKEHGGLFMTLDTMEWEAEDFYLKQGYKVEFVREGYLQNAKLIFLRKDFSL